MEADKQLLALSTSITIPTLISRITGFLKSLIIVALLGAEITSSFTVANQLPNYISELLLGAVLTAIVVPLLIQAEIDDIDSGALFLNRIFTTVLILLSSATFLALLAAPILSQIFLGAGKVSLHLTTIFALLLLPQIVFYGLTALFSATLNVKGSFLPAAWAPVVNNIICLITLALYKILPGEINTSNTTLTNPKILVLGLGTTLGIVIQALILVPFLIQKQVKLKLVWGIDSRLKEFANMTFSIILYVLISQIGLAISLRISNHTLAAGPTIYSYTWMLLQLPYGVFGVSILTAFMPNISRAAKKQNYTELLNYISMAIRSSLIILIPCAIFLLFFGINIGELLFDHGRFMGYGSLTGATISAAGFTIIPYAILLIYLRLFYAQKKSWHAVYIIIGITLAKILLSYAITWFSSNEKIIIIWQSAANGMSFIIGVLISYLMAQKFIPNFFIKKGLTTLILISIIAIIGCAISYFLLNFLLPNHLNQSFSTNLCYLILNGLISIAIIVSLILFVPLPEILYFRENIIKNLTTKHLLTGIFLFFTIAIICGYLVLR